MVDHPNHVVDYPTEIMMVGLGGNMCSCVAAAVYLPRREAVPELPNIPAHYVTNLVLRALYTAVQWAQHDDTEWSPELGEQYLRYGITPQTLNEWDHLGWSRKEVLPFQQNFVSQQAATVWLEDGQSSKRAAKLAALGENPGTEAKWISVGFSKTESSKWRATGLEPEEAYEWYTLGASPSVAVRIKQQIVRHQDTGSDITEEVIKQWGATGDIPISCVTSWYTATGGNYIAASVWSEILGENTWFYKALSSIVYGPHTITPGRIVAPALIEEYINSGIWFSPAAIQYAVNNNITPERVKRGVDSFRDDPDSVIPMLMVQHGYEKFPSLEKVELEKKFMTKRKCIPYTASAIVEIIQMNGLFQN